MMDDAKEVARWKRQMNSRVIACAPCTSSSQQKHHSCRRWMQAGRQRLRRIEAEKKQNAAGNRRVRGMALASSSSSSSSSTTEVMEIRDDLLRLCGEDENVKQKQINELIEALQQQQGTKTASKAISSMPLLPGLWKLLISYKPSPDEDDDEDSTSFTSLQSWYRYLFKNGPSPLQKLVVSNNTTSSSSSPIQVYQVLELEQGEAGQVQGGRFLNIIDFGETSGVFLVLEACVEDEELIKKQEGNTGSNDRIYFRFSRGDFIAQKLPFGLEIPSMLQSSTNSKAIRVPYPVPFEIISKIIPAETLGYLESLYIDEELRISKGNRGSVFVLKRLDASNDAASSRLTTAMKLFNTL